MLETYWSYHSKLSFSIFTFTHSYGKLLLHFQIYLILMGSILFYFYAAILDIKYIIINSNKKRCNPHVLNAYFCCDMIGATHLQGGLPFSSNTRVTLGVLQRGLRLVSWRFTGTIYYRSRSNYKLGSVWRQFEIWFVHLHKLQHLEWNQSSL